MTERIEMQSIIRKKTAGLALLLGAATMAYAQQKVNVTGKIAGPGGEAVPYASVTFSNKANKLYSDATLTDESGNYTLQLVPGSYEIIVEAIDFKKFTVVRQITGGTIGTLQISSEDSKTGTQTKNIEGVTITATAKPYKVEIDKKVYDPSQDIVSKGGNLQDVLANVPSVSVETDGTVSMRGNTNVRFLINGKPSALLGIDDGANALQSIPADQIERIEVITNPSSKFEAAGTAGILNIILKKSKRIGFNGSVTGSLGYLPQTSLNTNLSWRRGNLTWFLNGGGAYRESEGRFDTDMTYKNVTTVGNMLESHQRGTSENVSKNYNGSTGFVYDFNDRTSANASVTVRGFNSDENGTTDINELFYNSASIFTSRPSLGNSKNFGYQADFGLDHKFDDKGQLLLASLSLQGNQSESLSDTNEFANGIQKANELFSQDAKSRNIVGKLDYELPIGENSKLEAGYRIDNNNNNYDNKLNAWASSPNFIDVSQLYTNTTDYRELFNAFYAQFKSKVGNFGYQLGLRDEISNIKIDYRNLNGDMVNKTKTYNNLFPSVYLSYDITKDNQLLLNYSRRIDRPRSFFMVPYGRYMSNRSLFEGNIDLDPSYVNSFEFGYNISKRKFTINPTLYYRYATNDTKMLQYRPDESKNTLSTRPINLGTDSRYGLDMNFMYDVFSWWKLMGSLNIFGYKTEGLAQYNVRDASGNNVTRTRDFSGSGLSNMARLNSTFRIDKTLSMQLQGFYRGGQKTATSKTDPMYAVNFGASKTIWKGDGTITFNIQDIFNTRNRTVYAFTDDFDSRSYMQWMPRQASISLTYRFKQGEKIEQPKRRKDINANEQGGDDQGPM